MESFRNPEWVKKQKTHTYTDYPISRIDASAVLPLNAILKKFIRGERIPIGTGFNYRYNEPGHDELMPSDKKGFDFIDALNLERELDAKKNDRHRQQQTQQKKQAEAKQSESKTEVKPDEKKQ